MITFNFADGTSIDVPLNMELAQSIKIAKEECRFKSHAVPVIHDLDREGVEIQAHPGGIVVMAVGSTYSNPIGYKDNGNVAREAQVDRLLGGVKSSIISFKSGRVVGVGTDMDTTEFVDVDAEAIATITGLKLDRVRKFLGLEGE